MPCPSAWTPASVRPAPSTGWRIPPFRRASAASSSPWTVRAPGCSWKPANSVPSYSTVARNRLTAGPSRRGPSATLASVILGATSSDELDLDDFGAIARALADLHDPGVAGGPIGVLGGDLVEELGDHERLVRELRDDRSTCRQVAALGDGDHPL